MPQYAQVLTPTGQLQQVQVVPAHHLASLQQAVPATAASAVSSQVRALCRRWTASRTAGGSVRAVG